MSLSERLPTQNRRFESAGAETAKAPPRPASDGGSTRAVKLSSALCEGGVARPLLYPRIVAFFPITQSQRLQLFEYVTIAVIERFSHANHGERPRRAIKMGGHTLVSPAIFEAK